MENYTTRPRSKTSGIKRPDALYQIYLTRWITFYSPPMSPNAFRLSKWLGGRFDANQNNGVINPPLEWILHNLNITAREFVSLTDELALKEQWRVHKDDDGVITEYVPLMFDAVHSMVPHLKQLRTSVVHDRCIVRYSGGKPLASAIEILATSKIDPVFNDLGYRRHRKAGREPIHVIPLENGRYYKHCQSVFFNHPMMNARTDEECAALASITRLTESDVSSPIRCSINAQKVARKFELGTDWLQEIQQALQDIQDNGWYEATLVPGEGCDFGNPDIVFTPTLKFHNLAWEHHLISGGQNTTRWESEHGFLPDSQSNGSEAVSTMDTLPPIGMHYLYYLQSTRTGRIIEVGQTTQTPRARERQHQRMGTNETVNRSILAINADPDDTLRLVPVALVHHRVCAQREMDLLHKMRAVGHRLENVIDDVDRNRRTIHIDSRLDSRTDKQLESILLIAERTHGLEQYFIKELPKPIDEQIAGESSLEPSPEATGAALAA